MGDESFRLVSKGPGKYSILCDVSSQIVSFSFWKSVLTIKKNTKTLFEYKAALPE